MPADQSIIVTIDRPTGRTDELIRDQAGYRWRSTQPAPTTRDLIEQLQMQRAAFAARMAEAEAQARHRATASAPPSPYPIAAALRAMAAPVEQPARPITPGKVVFIPARR